jgi:hypothetical protein
VRQTLGETAAEPTCLSTLELEQAEAAGDAELLVRGLGETRFELLQLLETAPDSVWEQPVPAAAAKACGVASRVELDWLLLSARLHEQQHVAAVWEIALNWDRGSLDTPSRPGVPLHPADRLEESH